MIQTTVIQPFATAIVVPNYRRMRFEIKCSKTWFGRNEFAEVPHVRGAPWLQGMSNSWIRTKISSKRTILCLRQYPKFRDPQGWDSDKEEYMFLLEQPGL